MAIAVKIFIFKSFTGNLLTCSSVSQRSTTMTMKIISFKATAGLIEAGGFGDVHFKNGKSILHFFSVFRVRFLIWSFLSTILTCWSIHKGERCIKGPVPDFSVVKGVQFLSIYVYLLFYHLCCDLRKRRHIKSDKILYVGNAG